MAVNPNNTDYQEFLILISDILRLGKYRVLINYEDKFTATLEQLNEYAKKIEVLDFKREVFELNEDAYKQISDTEVKKYLKELTDNFDIELTKTALLELEVFESMVFDETLNHEAVTKYIDKGWEVPTYEVTRPINKEIINFPDYKKMRNKLFPFTGMQLYVAKNYLQRALQPPQKVKEDLSDNAEQLKPALTKEKTEEIKPFNFTNNFDTISPQVIYKHFKEGLVDSKMLTVVELENYLKAAFEDMKPPKKLFTLKNVKTKNRVQNVFSKYYREIAGKEQGRQIEYVELLSKYFQGYKTENVKTNWTK